MNTLAQFDRFLTDQGFPPGPIAKASRTPSAADVATRAGALMRHLTDQVATLKQRHAQNAACVLKMRAEQQMIPVFLGLGRP